MSDGSDAWEIIQEVADEVMLEANNYMYVYDGYQDKLSDYAKKVVENGWVGTSKDRVPFTATKYVVNAYLDRHSTRKKNIASICVFFAITPVFLLKKYHFPSICFQP